MVYLLKLPTKDPNLTFQIYDKDILTPDDFVSEVTLNFQRLAQEAFENDSTVKLYQQDSALTQTKKNLTEKFNNFDFNSLKNENQGNKENEEKKKGIASNEKVEIMLQNAKKEGYVIKFI